MDAPPIPVTVIGGYLGAGKTTLVNHVLRSSPERVAVIVNDFGEISIDEDLIVAADGEKLTLANGCICCTLADGFAAALMQVRASQPVPTRLLIEASGVSDPAQVAAYGHTPGLRLDAVIVMADAETVRSRAQDRWVGDTVRLQLAAADLVVLNKIDLVGDPASVPDLLRWLDNIAPDTSKLTAVGAAVPLDVVFEPEIGDDGSSVDDVVRASDGDESHQHHHPHTADDIFESRTIELSEPVAAARMTALLADLPDAVLRLKGLVQLVSDSPHRSQPAVTDHVVQAVGRRSTITSSQPHRHHVIGIVARRGELAVDWPHQQLGLPQ